MATKRVCDICDKEIKQGQKYYVLREFGLLRTKEIEICEDCIKELKEFKKQRGV